MANLIMNIDPNYNHILTEHGNTFIALRKIQWTDKSDYKLDLRKYITKSDGEEQAQKGCCFDDETANELVKVLLETGYGNTDDIVDSIKDRADFNNSIARTLSTEQICLIRELKENNIDDIIDLDEKYYDIRSEFIDE